MDVERIMSAHPGFSNVVTSVLRVPVHGIVHGDELLQNG